MNCFRPPAAGRFCVPVEFQHRIHAADQVLDFRPVADLRLGRHDGQLDATEELDRLAADQAEVNFRAFPLPLAGRGQYLLENVRIQPAAEAAVGAHHDDAYGLDLAFHQVRIPGVRVREPQVTDHAPDPVCVRLCGAHALLRLAHLARGDGFHGLGDLLRALDARDLDPDFFRAGHGINRLPSMRILRRSSCSPPRLPC